MSNISEQSTNALAEGQETDSQIFAFSGENTLPLALLKNDENVCLTVAGDKLGSSGCSGGNAQDFTIG